MAKKKETALVKTDIVPNITIDIPIGLHELVVVRTAKRELVLRKRQKATEKELKDIQAQVAKARAAAEKESVARITKLYRGKYLQAIALLNACGASLSPDDLRITVEIRWPDGRTRRWKDVRANQRLTVVPEGGE